MQSTVKFARSERIEPFGNGEAKTRYVPACLIAALYVGLGDKERAFAWLDKAFQERDVLLLTLNIESHMDPLRSDQRFQDLVRRVGLPT